MANAWIGVGVVNWAAANFCCNAEEIGSSVNDVIKICYFLERSCRPTHTRPELLYRSY